MDSRDIADLISQHTGVTLQQASEEALADLASLGFPANARDFYARHEPSEYAEIGGVRLWPVADILVENRGAVPGVDLQPRGFPVFATTVYGDAYCFDLGGSVAPADAPVVLLSHELAWSEMDNAQLRALSPDGREIVRGIPATIRRIATRDRACELTAGREGTSVYIRSPLRGQAVRADPGRIPSTTAQSRLGGSAAGARTSSASRVARAL